MFYRRHTTSQDDEPYHILGVTGLSAVHQRENGLESTVISLSERKAKHGQSRAEMKRVRLKRM